MDCLTDIFKSRGNKEVNLKKMRNKILTSTEFMQVWFHYDKDKNGYLEYVEFCQFMKDLFVKKDTSNITAKEVEKYTRDMIEIMETHDENKDGKFEMSELANLLKLERNFLDNMIGQQAISDKQVKAILSHYNSNSDCTIEGPELYAFVGDIARHLGLKLSLPVIEAGMKRVKEIVGTDTIDTAAIRSLLTAENVQKLKLSFDS